MGVPACVAALALALALPASWAEPVRFGSLQLDLPAGHTVVSNQTPIKIRMANGGELLITVMRRPVGPSGALTDDEMAQTRALVGRAQAATAAKLGALRIPPTRESLAAGVDLLFTGNETKKLFSSGHFLQYALVSPQGQLAFITLEGSGDAAVEHEKALPWVRAALWADDSASEAQFTERVAGLMRAALPGDEVKVAGPLTLKRGDLQANLDRVWAFCQRDASNCNAELDRYVAAVKEAVAQTPKAPERAQLRLVIRREDYGQGAVGSGKPPEFLQRPFADGLISLVAVDHPRTLAMLDLNGAQKMGLGADGARQVAQANLQQQLGPLRAKPVRAGQLGRLAGDAYEVSRLLLPDGWAELAQAQGGVLLVALPTTDLLLYAGDDSPQAIDALRSLSKESMARAPNPLTNLILRWTPQGWLPVR